MTSYDINHPPVNLQHNDKIVFHVPGHNRLEYKVFSDHINNRTDSCNRMVFIELGIGDEYDYSLNSPIVTICSAAYGYDAGSGDWPIFHAGDYDAATRIVNHVFSLIAQLTLPEEMKQSTINHPQGFIPRRILKPEPVQEPICQF
jgi:hypothetical protein